MVAMVRARTGRPYTYRREPRCLLPRRQRGSPHSGLRVDARKRDAALPTAYSVQLAGCINCLLAPPQLDAGPVRTVLPSGETVTAGVRHSAAAGRVRCGQHWSAAEDAMSL